MTPRHRPSTGDIRSRLGRFDQSFFIRMVVSFFVFTVAVAAVEIGVRFGVLLYEFHREGEEVTENAARQLANDVTRIMVNRGGPVASRTVYPILERNFQRARLDIAIEPSPVTRTSIRNTLGFDPQGIPASWPDGVFKETRVEIAAEEVCLRCHVDAAVGDVLGTVTVRDYLGSRLAAFWGEAGLTGTLNFLKAVLHTVILFFLLRTLMAPLLSLRSAVSRLAKGGAGLSIRAQVRSSDEFGELADDLNAFLDRVDHILHDFENALTKMIRVTDRLSGVTEETQRRVDEVERTLVAALSEAGSARPEGDVPLDDQLADLERLLDDLDRTVDTAPAERARTAAALQQRIRRCRAAWRRYLGLVAGLSPLVYQVKDLGRHVSELGLLEEHLADVAQAGRRLLDRLLGPDHGHDPSPEG